MKSKYSPLFSSQKQEVKTFTTVDELEAFILKHGENIVDLMGGEIDRIEIKLRVKNIRHNFCILFNWQTEHFP